MVSSKGIVGVVISLILMGVLLPLGLNEILQFTSTNATITTLVATIVPIVAIVSIVLAIVPKGE